MYRAIAVLSLVGLLSAGLLLAAEGTPPAGSVETAGLCAAPSSGAPEPIFVQEGCSALVYCPDGSQVSCSSRWDYCENLSSCSGFPFFDCGVRCLNTWRFCPGYGPSNCGC